MEIEQVLDLAPNEKGYFDGKKIWVTGHLGMLGSALVEGLRKQNSHLLLASRGELDLTNQSQVMEWMEAKRPDVIFHAGARVGGIYANSTMPADFLFANLMMEANVIHTAKTINVKKLIFVGSNCSYPVDARQPITEDAVLTGPLEQNIHSYAVSKIAGIELCRAYRRQYGCNFVTVIPPNLYGPGDNYHPNHGHVVSGIMRRAYEAKCGGKESLQVWGDGTARRELLHVRDLADAMILLMRTETLEHDVYNVGSSHDLSIAELASLICEVVEYQGKIIYDKTKPNGTMRKLLDSSRIASLGWKPKIDDRSGLSSAFLDFKDLLKKPDKGHRY